MRTLAINLMKYANSNNQLSVLILTCFFCICRPASAQPIPYSEYLKMQSNIEANARSQIDTVRSNTEYHRLHPTQADLAAESNAIADFSPPQEWPNTFDRQSLLRHDADILRLAVDTNQIAIATNQSLERRDINDLLDKAAKYLNEAANLLTNRDLTVSLTGAGYQAGKSTSTNDFLFEFWTENHLPGVVSGFEIRTPDAGNVLESANFYENGKLRYLQINSPDKNQHLRAAVELEFSDKGALDLHWKRSAEN